MIDAEGYEQESQQEQQQQIPYKNPMDRYGSAIIKLTNPLKDINELEYYFAGKERDSLGNMKQMYEPLMNQDGIRSIIGQVKAFANQSGILSDLNDVEIKKSILDSFSDTLIKDLLINKQKYEITNKAARDIILSNSRQLVFLISKRAEDGNDKRFWAKIQHEFTQIIDGSNKKSLMDRANTWGKKNL